MSAHAVGPGRAHRQLRAADRHPGRRAGIACLLASLAAITVLAYSTFSCIG